ncbi:MAG: hypothetical protein QNJ20_02160 [Paracoccaceae bacterium]|nr:hypothetical protein [Paracoccaceae bacterium]
MSKHSTAAKVEDLAQEAASLPANDGKTLSDEVTDLLARLAKENDAMKEEMHAMKKSVQNTMKMGKDELKSEIAHHPIQSIATAFALGFIASLFVRR